MSAMHARLTRFQHIPQSRRRVIAVATLLGMPAMFAWSTYWEGTTAPALLYGPITFLLLFTTIIGALVLYLYVRNRADMPGKGLDERERQLRDRAWILSYQVLSGVVTVA